MTPLPRFYIHLTDPAPTVVTFSGFVRAVNAAAAREKVLRIWPKYDPARITVRREEDTPAPPPDDLS